MNRASGFVRIILWEPSEKGQPGQAAPLPRRAECGVSCNVLQEILTAVLYLALQSGVCCVILKTNICSIK